MLYVYRYHDLPSSHHIMYTLAIMLYVYRYHDLPSSHHIMYTLAIMLYVYRYHDLPSSHHIMYTLAIMLYVYRYHDLPSSHHIMYTLAIMLYVYRYHDLPSSHHIMYTLAIMLYVYRYHDLPSLHDSRICPDIMLRRCPVSIVFGGMSGYRVNQTTPLTRAPTRVQTSHEQTINKTGSRLCGVQVLNSRSNYILLPGLCSIDRSVFSWHCPDSRTTSGDCLYWCKFIKDYI